MSAVTLADVLRASETDPFLLAGPPSPEPGWVYRDFYPMPKLVWLALVDLLGEDNIKVVAASSQFLPPAEMCRAQIWISPEARALWSGYLRERAP